MMQNLLGSYIITQEYLISSSRKPSSPPHIILHRILSTSYKPHSPQNFPLSFLFSLHLTSSPSMASLSTTASSISVHHSHSPPNSYQTRYPVASTSNPSHQNPTFPSPSLQFQRPHFVPFCTKRRRFG
ncbi:hypothetical protein AKJ16_DCAP07408 [Drosera capensis]